MPKLNRFLFPVFLAVFFLILPGRESGYGAGITGKSIFIPRDYPSIQEGIERARDGDIVLVGPGRYPENINFKGKAIIVKSV